MAWDTAEELPLLLSDGKNSYIYGPESLPIKQISNGGTTSYCRSSSLLRDVWANRAKTTVIASVSARLDHRGSDSPVSRPKASRSVANPKSAASRLNTLARARQYGGPGMERRPRYRKGRTLRLMRLLRRIQSAWRGIKTLEDFGPGSVTCASSFQDTECER
jgi:hypothetical protein